MFCENCGSPIQDTDKICPKCGRVVETPAENIATEAESVTTEAESVTKEAEKTEVQASEENVTAETVAETAEPVSEKKKSSKGVKIVLAVVAAVVVLLAVVGVANAAKISNLIHSFQAPEKYYAYVEKKNVEQVADILAEQYAGNLTGAFFPFNTARHLLRDGAVNLDYTFTLGEGSKDLMDMAKASGVDLSWIQNGKISAQMGMKGNVLLIGADADVNETDLISANMLLDIEGDAVYFQIPEFSEKYLAINNVVFGMSDPEVIETLDTIRNVLDECPDKEQVRTLTAKYAMVVLNSLQEVTKETGYELTVGDITQKCTKLEVALTEENWKAIMEALAKEAETDATLRELVVNICNATGEVDGEEAYDEFLQGLTDMKDNYYTEYGEYVMRVFVDNKGIIRGREIELPDSVYEIYEYINYKMPLNGKNYGLELAIQSEGTLVTMNGSGTQTGNSMDGTYIVAVDGTNFMEMKVSENDMTSAYTGKAKMEINLTSEAKELINEELDESYGEYSGIMAKMLSEFRIVLDVKSEANSIVEDAVVYFGEDEFMTVNCTVNAVEASDIQTPEESNTILFDDEEAYIAEIDWTKLLSNLETMNLPTEYLEAVESFAAMMTLYNTEYVF